MTSARTGFLDLPPELREQIYILAFDNNEILLDLPGRAISKHEEAALGAHLWFPNRQDCRPAGEVDSEQASSIRQLLPPFRPSTQPESDLKPEHVKTSSPLENSTEQRMIRPQASPSDFNPSTLKAKSPTTTGILFTCRTIYNEAWPYYYQQTRFTFASIPSAKIAAFLHHLPSIAKQNIRFLNFTTGRKLANSKQEAHIPFDPWLGVQPQASHPLTSPPIKTALAASLLASLPNLQRISMEASHLGSCFFRQDLLRLLLWRKLHRVDFVWTATPPPCQDSTRSGLTGDSHQADDCRGCEILAEPLVWELGCDLRGQFDKQFDGCQDQIREDMMRKIGTAPPWGDLRRVWVEENTPAFCCRWEGDETYGSPMGDAVVSFFSSGAK